MVTFVLNMRSFAPAIARFNIVRTTLSMLPGYKRYSIHACACLTVALTTVGDFLN